MVEVKIKDSITVAVSKYNLGIYVVLINSFRDGDLHECKSK